MCKTKVVCVCIGISKLGLCVVSFGKQLEAAVVESCCKKEVSEGAFVVWYASIWFRCG